ncbi:MAG: hypothetical protein IPL89_09475 [Acidobacteria bacterium]|nr:hypothetical protein [Acidobacteriota bacterium]
MSDVARMPCASWTSTESGVAVQPGAAWNAAGAPKISRKRACSFATTASISPRVIRGRWSCQSM